MKIRLSRATCLHYLDMTGVSFVGARGFHSITVIEDNEISTANIQLHALNYEYTIFGKNGSRMKVRIVSKYTYYYNIF